jgi:hypothetical protein
MGSSSIENWRCDSGEVALLRWLRRSSSLSIRNPPPLRRQESRLAPTGLTGAASVRQSHSIVRRLPGDRSLYCAGHRPRLTRRRTPSRLANFSRRTMLAEKTRPNNRPRESLAIRAHQLSAFEPSRSKTAAESREIAAFPSGGLPGHEFQLRLVAADADSAAFFWLDAHWFALCRTAVNRPCDACPLGPIGTLARARQGMQTKVAQSESRWRRGLAFAGAAA